MVSSPIDSSTAMGLGSERHPAASGGRSASSRPSRCLRRRSPPSVRQRTLDGSRPGMRAGRHAQPPQCRCPAGDPTELAATRIDVSAARARCAACQPGISLHRPGYLKTRTSWRSGCGIPVTSVARTLLDLGQVVHGRAIYGGRSMRRNACGLFDLRRGRAADRPQSRGTVALERSTALLCQTTRGPPPITRSELERLFLDLCHEAGLPRPQTNILVAGLSRSTPPGSTTAWSSSWTATDTTAHARRSRMTASATPSCRPPAIG